MLSGAESETYGKGCCLLTLFLFFLPMFVGILYSFGAFRGRRKDNPDDPTR
jgi:putative effector of murein hydrolase LrgA (UPF0299 family)